ncbi:MAG TPA: zinc ribbon domain-containing protein [Planctomycetota bacterium]|nr:zinc ribbon domain-containing protein [Planctomycetota bacterium]
MGATSDGSSEREQGVGERVRFCLECGAVLPFDATRCPACGASEPGARPAGEAGATCPACGALGPAGLLFCGACGAEVGARARLPVPTPRSAARLAEDGPPERASALAMLSLVLAVLAPLLAAFVAAEVLLGAAPR